MNKNVWHLEIVPEDEAYVDLANGFVRMLPQNVQRRIRIYPAQGGYEDAYAKAEELLRGQNEKRIVLILTDFDSPSAPHDVTADDEAIVARVDKAKGVCANDGLNQTFALGPLQEAENLRRELSGRETEATRRLDVTAENAMVKVGMLFASDDMVCDESLWECAQLRHTYNKKQIESLCALLRRKLLAEIHGAHV